MFDAGRISVHRMYFGDKHMNAIDFIHDAFREDMSIDFGVLENERTKLYYGPYDNSPEEDRTNV